MIELNPYKKCACAAILAAAAAFPAALHARLPARAHAQVSSWVASHGGVFGESLRPPSGSVLTAARNGTNLFHSVALSDGGFAVVSDSDGTILAFSGEGSFATTNSAPLWDMLLAATRAAPAGNRPGFATGSESEAPSLPDGVTVTETTVPGLLLSSTSISSQSGIEDLRVPPLIKSKWDQKTAGGKKVYNYYTPGGVYCGCVATAMAQLMRFHEYPTGQVAAKTRKCLYNNAATNLTMQGGTYSWPDMPLVPTSSISEAQRQAIGKLTSDAGISVHMQYASGGSAASTMVAAYALTNTWGFAQTQFAMSGGSGGESDGYMIDDEIHGSILASLDAGYPCILGIQGSRGGHAVVADGYGYTGSQRYIHLNMGWSGSCDYWYFFPISAGGYTFNELDEAMYNVFPTNTGNIVSGHVTDSRGNAIAGATVNWSGYKAGRRWNTPVSGTAVTSDYGVYAFIVPNANVTITSLTVSLEGYRPAAADDYMEASQSKSYAIIRSYIENDPTDLRYNSNIVPVIGNSWGNDLTLEAYPVDPSFASTPALSPTDGSLTLAVRATAGTTWTLQWNDDLSDAAGWRNLTTIKATGASQAIVLDSEAFDWSAHPTAFFRLAAADTSP